MGPVRGGVGDSWVLLFNKELVLNQIMSLRTLQKASYFSRGKSLGSDNGYLQDLGGPTGNPLTSHSISPTHFPPMLAVLQHARGNTLPPDIRVACSLTSFCPYPNVTISMTPSPDATPKITNYPPTSPCHTHSPFLFSKAALVSSWTHVAI